MTLTGASGQKKKNILQGGQKKTVIHGVKYVIYIIPIFMAENQWVSLGLFHPTS